MAQTIFLIILLLTFIGRIDLLTIFVGILIGGFILYAISALVLWSLFSGRR